MSDQNTTIEHECPVVDLANEEGKEVAFGIFTKALSCLNSYCNYKEAVEDGIKPGDPWVVKEGDSTTSGLVAGQLIIHPSGLEYNSF